MGIVYNQDTSNCKTALDILTQYPSTVGKDNYYMVFPQGRNAPGQLVYCDMTTDGGGWMLIARSHPSVVNYNGQNWGWLGGSIGSVKDHSQAYQAGWYSIWNNSGNTFTEMIFGNQKNNSNNQWGYFIYKKSNINYTTLMTVDAAYNPTSSVIQYDTNVWSRTNYPVMQSILGWVNSANSGNLYFMRDSTGFTTGYGAKANGMATVYCVSDTTLGYAGPWCGGSSVDGSGNYLSGTYLTAGGNRYGGTNQYLMMVR